MRQVQLQSDLSSIPLRDKLVTAAIALACWALLIGAGIWLYHLIT